MDFDVIISDLNAKLPQLSFLLRREYAPYLNTVGTVFLGWLIVRWVSQLFWTLFTPLTISAIAVVLICPTTAVWCLKQLGPNLEVILNDFTEKIQTSFVDLR